MGAATTGTETFVFTDIEDSTGLLRACSDERYHSLQSQTHDVVRRAFSPLGGREVGAAGDGLFFVFDGARGALAAAVDAQRALALEVWPATGGPRVRIGIHTGEAVFEDGDIAGVDVVIASRVCGAARGGEILVSAATAALTEGALPERVQLVDVGPCELKGIGARRLHRVIHPELPELPARSAVRNQLPPDLTTFIGREAAITDVRDALEHFQLVTLLGAGGVGKTRLAVRVAQELESTFADGVVFVDLTSAVDEHAVATAVSAALRAQEQPGETPLDAAITHLRGRHLLLILDNAEQVAEACGTVADRLVGSTSSRLLVTSRIALRSQAETLIAVEPLETPEAGASPEHAESVRLFVDRARRVRRPFTLDRSNASAVANICRQLDGLPLAIELAAARVGLLTPEQISAELTRSLDLVGDRTGTRPKRHHSLTACVDWSFGLLPPLARTLAHRLTVFSGGFDLAAARAVCTDETLPPDEVLDTLMTLVDASIVTVDDRVGRCRMLDTIRHYAAEGLDDSDVWRDRHIAWCVDLAASIASEDEVGALARLEDEHDNLFSAIESSCSSGRPDAALRMLAALWLVLIDRGVVDEVVTAATRALELTVDEPSTDRVYVQFALALGCLNSGDLETAVSSCHEGIATAELLEDAEARAWGRNVLGWLALTKHDPGAEEPLREAVAHARSTGSPRMLSDALIGLGMTEALTGRPRQGVADLEESVRVAAEHGFTVGFQPAALAFLGSARIIAGDLRGALDALDDALVLIRARPGASHWFHTPFTITVRGVALVLKGEVDEARTSIDRLAEAHAPMPHLLVHSILAVGSGMAAQWAGDVRAAREAYTGALVFTADPFWGQWSRFGLAQLALLEGDIPTAKAHAAGLRQHLLGHGDAFHACRLEIVRGDIARAEGDLAEAMSRYSEALRGSAAAEMLIVVVDALECLARTLGVRQQAELGGRLLGAADALRERTAYARTPIHIAQMADDLAILERDLGAERLDELRAEGANRSMDEVLALALAGRSPHRGRARAGWDSLTPAERNIVTLVAEGLSNPMIAERLFISRRTVDRHLSNVFTKTGVTSRAQLASEATRRAASTGNG